MHVEACEYTFCNKERRHILHHPAIYFQTDSSLGALGGALSLFLGVALIMLFEMAELAYDVAANCWRHVKARGKK